MIFTKRTDFLPEQTGIALGATIRQELTREFHIESIWVRLKVTPTAAMATANADALQNILQRVQLSVSDGARTRNVVDASGAGLLEFHQQIVGALDRSTAALIGTNPASGEKIFYYPIWFSHPQISDPVGSIFLLPAPRYNSNPVLTLTVSSQAQMDVNLTPTFAATCKIQVIVNRRQVTSANWPTLDTEIAEYEQSYAATGNGQLYELQIPGSYTGLLLRDYTSTSARGSIQTAGGENKLQFLGTVLRRFQVENIMAENDVSVNMYPATWNNFGGLYYLDFLTDKVGEASADLGSVLDANILQTTGARLQLLQDITGGAGVKRKYLHHRVFGKLSALKFGAPAS